MKPIHTFKNPPIIETVLGVQFPRLEKLKNPHLAKFWSELGGEQWPVVEDAPPLEPQYERFGDEREWAMLGKVNLRFAQTNESRLRIANAGRTRMIQVQNGRFHYNWLKSQGGEDYPRYSVVKAEFDRYWMAFTAFLEKNAFEQPVPDQWEVTYIDHMAKGTVWQNPDDWSTLFRGLPILGKPIDFLSPENFLCRFEFEIAPRMGRLHVELHHGFTGDASISEREELVRMVLTARGPVKEGACTVDEGIALGRKAVVEAFHGLTSEAAHKFWGYENG